MKNKRTASWLASVYLREIVRLHGVPSSIVSDRDPIFTSQFWNSLQEAMGIRLSLKPAYHPQTNGQTERVNRVLEDLLRLCILDFGGTWEDHLTHIITVTKLASEWHRSKPYMEDRACRQLVGGRRQTDLYLGPT